MPASVLGAHSAIKRRVLALVYLLQPDTAHKRRVEKEIHFLAVVEGLRVEVSVSLYSHTLINDHKFNVAASLFVFIVDRFGLVFGYVIKYAKSGAFFVRMQGEV